MSNDTNEIWFWQLIISPHMVDLAVALARLGYRVTYVAQQAMSDDRAGQGWSVPALPGVNLQWADSDAAVRQLVRCAPAGAVHVCQGARANGRIRLAQRELAQCGRQQWVVMETVDDAKSLGFLKRLVYAGLFHFMRASLQGVLTNGHRTADWVVARGMPAAHVFPFAYFLPVKDKIPETKRPDGVFRFFFAGQLIARKRVDWLIDALSPLADREFELCIVGSGPDEAALRALADARLGARVHWLGQLPYAQVPAVMAQSDCLVLPSLHDGWGAVGSEALMAGTPVVCSESCGVAGVVRASGDGGVFATGDRDALAALLRTRLDAGSVTPEQRHRLAAWATCLGAAAGAAYLHEILTNTKLGNIERPVEPWLRGGRSCAA